ncbi:gfo/Idh/MocA family oxidoreductase, partial [bacterium]|nr:gfo/Idh/MocA family oxidoreductase [bacterium]
LGRDDIDAVMISTPDHWHVPMAILAAKAGKDISCEKPLTLSIAEGRLLSDTVKKHNRVFRTDSEFRSHKAFHRAVELVRNGVIGELHTIFSGVPSSDVGCPPQPKMPVPPELNYPLWLGPGEKAPYTLKRVHPRHGYGRPGWMRCPAYCEGMVSNWGTHLNDIAQWGHNSEHTGPVEVEGFGRHPKQEGLWKVMNYFELEYKYADGVKLYYVTDKPYIRFEGSEGWVQVEFSGLKLTASSDAILNAELGADAVRFPLKSEKQDFIDAVKTRGKTLADAEVGHRTTSLCQIGHIACQVGKKLYWDPNKEIFTNSDQANGLLTRELHGEWSWESL